MMQSDKQANKERIEKIFGTLKEMCDENSDCAALAAAYEGDTQCHDIAYGYLCDVIPALLVLTSETRKIVEQEFHKTMTSEAVDLLADEIEDVWDSGKISDIFADFKEAMETSEDSIEPIEEDPTDYSDLPEVALNAADELADAAELSPELNLLAVIFCGDPEDTYEVLANCDAAHALNSLLHLLARLRKVEPEEDDDQYEDIWESMPDVLLDVLLGSPPMEVLDDWLLEVEESLEEKLEIPPKEMLRNYLRAATYDTPEDAIEDVANQLEAVVTAFPDVSIMHGIQPGDTESIHMIMTGPPTRCTFVLLAMINGWYQQLREEDLTEFQMLKTVFPQLVQRICSGETLDEILASDLSEEEPEPRNRAERRRMQRNRKR